MPLASIAVRVILTMQTSNALQAGRSWHSVTGTTVPVSSCSDQWTSNVFLQWYSFVLEHKWLPFPEDAADHVRV